MYLNYKQRNIAKEVNKRSANIIMKAMSYTKRASAEAINSLMRREIVVSEVVKYPKAGKPGRGEKVQAKAPKTYRHGTIAGYRIYNYWRKRRGMNPLGGKAMAMPLKLFIDSLVRSTAYITSGWFPALSVYRKSVKSMQGVKAPNNPKGTASKGGAIPAIPGKIIRSYFWNCAYPRSRSNTRLKTPSEYAGPALDLALEIEKQDMKEWLEEQMKLTADKVFK